MCLKWELLHLVRSAWCFRCVRFYWVLLSSLMAAGRSDLCSGEWSLLLALRVQQSRAEGAALHGVVLGWEVLSRMKVILANVPQFATSWISFTLFLLVVERDSTSCAWKENLSSAVKELLPMSSLSYLYFYTCSVVRLSCLGLVPDSMAWMFSAATVWMEIIISLLVYMRSFTLKWLAVSPSWQDCKAFWLFLSSWKPLCPVLCRPSLFPEDYILKI